MTLSFPPPQPLIAAMSLAKSSPCTVDADSPQCRLLDYLHLLNVIGAVLAVVLVMVLAFAVHSWIVNRDASDLPPTPFRRGKEPRP